MRIIEYDRISAVAYAKKWAYKRNNKYYNFDSIDVEICGIFFYGDVSGAAMENLGFRICLTI